MSPRIKRTEGRFAKVDGIPFTLPVRSAPSPVLMAAFQINATKAKALMPEEIHPLRLWNDKALLVVTVINYLETNIGKYIEYSVAVACTHGKKAAPKMLPAIFQGYFNTGQYVLDLPVSTEVSVKGGKGIWGMPKHIGNLNFRITEDKVTSQYDLDDKLVNYVEIDRPGKFSIPIRTNASNYCAFRGMLMKSDVFIKGSAHMAFGKKAKAKFVIGDHPRAQYLHQLEIEENPLFTAYIPDAVGTLDDHMQSWFLHQASDVFEAAEGMESVVNLGQGEDWPAAPTAEIKASVFSTEADITKVDSDHKAA
ncbi:MAG: acetoacetate decarboxylase family protein [Gammaproteobacteria bacterium]|nr:acetoacetate decarboxylase family protein [Gammaproteobacteria bacterium]